MGRRRKTRPNVVAFECDDSDSNSKSDLVHKASKTVTEEFFQSCQHHPHLLAHPIIISRCLTKYMKCQTNPELIPHPQHWKLGQELLSSLLLQAGLDSIFLCIPLETLARRFRKQGH